MRIRGLIWIEGVADKLDWKHRVQQYEVEELIAGRPRIEFRARGHRAGEDVYSAWGRTESGRRLVVYFIYKEDGQALILSARDMTRTERRRYERR